MTLSLTVNCERPQRFMTEANPQRTAKPTFASGTNGSRVLIVGRRGGGGATDSTRPKTRLWSFNMCCSVADVDSIVGSIGLQGIWAEAILNRPIYVC